MGFNLIAAPQTKEEYKKKWKNKKKKMAEEEKLLTFLLGFSHFIQCRVKKENMLLTMVILL